MVKIDVLIMEGKVRKIPELELPRYLNFFIHSSQDNIQHSKAVIDAFPRWSIISGYYAMHDRAKLFLAQKFRLQMELEVHATTIKVLREVLQNKDILHLFERGYAEFITLANDLAQAKQERVRSQYYTGTAYMVQEYRKKAQSFLNEVVEPFLLNMEELLKL